jgi:predicted transcriptional regulator
MELSQSYIKMTMNNWVAAKIADYRKQGNKLTRTMMAQSLNVTPSCFSQYLNAEHPKAAPWEFQLKLAAMLHQSIRELHPELLDLSLSYSS